MQMPDNYNSKSISQIIDKYSSEAQELNKQRKQNINKETTIFILSESLANPLRLKSVSSDQNPLEFIDEIKTKTTSGSLYSDGYGGGTANMEFQSLTGLNMKYFNSNVSVLYSEIAPNMKRIPSISDTYKSDNRIVIHLDNAKNYNRLSVYNRLNFNTFIAKNGSKQKAKNIHNYGRYPSDQTTYQNILNYIDKKETQFIYGITMQNHGPYGNGPGTFKISGENFTPGENLALQEYTNRLSVTDSATKYFLNSLQKIDKPINVVFYGDHLPGIYPDNLFIHQDARKKMTDYFIWSNQESIKLNYPNIRSNDLPALLLESTSSTLTPYQALLKANLPDSNGTIDKKSAEDLKQIQYDLTVGKYHLKKYPEFFSVKRK